MVSAAMNLTDVALTATSPGMTARQVLRRPVWPVFVFAPDVVGLLCRLLFVQCGACATMLSTCTAS